MREWLDRLHSRKSSRLHTKCLFLIENCLASGYSNIALNSQLNLQLHRGMTPLHKCFCSLKRVRNKPAMTSSQLCTYSHQNKSDSKIICTRQRRRWINMGSDAWVIQILRKGSEKLNLLCCIEAASHKCSHHYSLTWCDLIRKKETPPTSIQPGQQGALSPVGLSLITFKSCRLVKVIQHIISIVYEAHSATTEQEARALAPGNNQEIWSC